MLRPNLAQVSSANLRLAHLRKDNVGFEIVDPKIICFPKNTKQARIAQQKHMWEHIAGGETRENRTCPLPILIVQTHAAPNPESTCHKHQIVRNRKTIRCRLLQWPSCPKNHNRQENILDVWSSRRLEVPLIRDSTVQCITRAYTYLKKFNCQWSSHSCLANMLPPSAMRHAQEITTWPSNLCTKPRPITKQIKEFPFRQFFNS